MICFPDLMLCLSPYIRHSHDSLQTLTYGLDRFSNIIHVWIRPKFLLHDFIIRFTDFMLFLSPYTGYRHDTWQKLFYGRDRFSSIHVWTRSIFCFNDMLHNYQLLDRLGPLYLEHTYIYMYKNILT